MQTCSLKISVIIPTYNGEKTLSRALQSLVDQNYADLEIIVVDAKSTDNSVEVIRQYEDHIAWWVSEADSGQSDAINKGFAKSTGEVVTWLCSDDTLMEGALQGVAKAFLASPEVDVVVGKGLIVHEEETPPSITSNNRSLLKFVQSILGTGDSSFQMSETDARSYTKVPTLKKIDLLPGHNPISQPSCFFRRRLIRRSFLVDEQYHYAMDTELWAYFKSQNAVWKCLDQTLSVSIQDGQNKTSTGGSKIIAELERLYLTYSSDLIPLTFWHKKFRYPIERFLVRHPQKIWVYLAGSVWLLITLMLAPFYGLERVWFMRWKRWA